MQVGPKRPLTEINVTPLVDVVLVLLIIFMVLTPLVEKQKSLKVPESAPAESAERPEVGEDAALTALPDGRVRFDGEVFALEAAAERLRVGYEGRPRRILYFDAEDGTSYELAFRALDAAQAAGVKTIALLTEEGPTAR
jgi:biopolymer transport protein TolR